MKILFVTSYVSTTVTYICLTPFPRHHRHWSNSGCWQWVTLVWGKPLSSGLQNLASRNSIYPLSYSAKHISIPQTI